ncbi:MAG: hypothetical protein MK371_07920 [SAR86 cluster bacterium]|nr:hypothetical protein [SAR86 cluster bacterium]
MSFSVETFRSKLESGGGPAYGDRYHVSFNAPTGVEFEAASYIKTEGVTNITSRLSWLCDTINIPSRSLTTTEFRTYGLPVKRPYGSVYTESQMEFLCTRNMGEKKFFDAWLNYIFDNRSYDMAYYDNYKTDIHIYHFDRSVSNTNDLSKSTYHIKLEEAYPTLVGEISMNHTATEILKLPITFTYKKYVHADINSASAEDE